jgi:polysaccharide export outer membrane protein
VGSVNLAGLTFGEAQNLVRKKIQEELIGTEITIELNELRSITVYILGEAYQPGAFTLSALSTVTNALFLSGGVNKLGSLRNIQIKRAGKLVNTYDLYDLLARGDTSTDLRLEDGDVIFIPFREKKVTAGGSFKRPHLYELREGETLKDVILFAGGFKSEVSVNPIIEYSTINRISNKREISNIVYSNKNFKKEVFDGDVVNVFEYSGLKSHSVELKGQFINPGVYSISEGETILDVISKAGGYTKSAFTEGAIFLRKEVADLEKEGFLRSADNLEQIMIQIVQDSTGSEGASISFEPFNTLISKLREIEPVGRVVTSLDTLDLKTDPYANFELRDGDSIYIPKRPSSVTIVGEVLNPTSIQYYSQNDIEDYIALAGGLNFQADKNRIYIINPNGEAQSYKRKYFRKNNNIISGSTIVITRSARGTFKVAQILAPIVADLSVSYAAISAISNFNR